MPRHPQASAADHAERETDLFAAVQADTPPGMPILDARGRPVIPGFRVLAQLGQSRTSQVWKVQLAGGFRALVAKILRPDLLDDRVIVQAFLSEGRLLAELEAVNGEHPHIVPVFDAGTFGNHLCVLMKYMPDGDLSAWLASEHPTGRVADPDAFLELAVQVTTGAAYLHDNGIIHRDLKPANIFVDRCRRRPVFRLGDLGLAIDQEGDAASGTPRYMAPEAFLRGTASAMSDVYALGATFYELLTGRPPFTSPTLAGLSELVRGTPAPLAHTLVPTVPEPLAILIDICLRKDPAQRYPDALALLTALRALQRDRLRPHGLHANEAPTETVDPTSR